MLQLKEGEYVGVLYDVVSETLMEISPIVRATPDAAYRDAQALIAPVNEMAEAFDDGDDNTSIGRVDDSYCFVQDGSGLMWDYPVVRAEERQLA